MKTETNSAHNATCNAAIENLAAALDQTAPIIDVKSLESLAVFEGNRHLKEQRRQLERETRAKFLDYSKALYKAASEIDITKLRYEYGDMLKTSAEAKIRCSVEPMNGFASPENREHLRGFLELVAIGSNTINRFINTIEQIASSPKALYKLREDQFRDMLGASSEHYATQHHNFSDILLGGTITRSSGFCTYDNLALVNRHVLHVEFSKTSQYLALTRFMAQVMEADRYYPRLELFLFEGHSRGNKYYDNPTMKKVFFELGLIQR